MSFSDHFDATALDTEVWVPHYLPQWSSRAESAAPYALAGSELRVSGTPDYPMQMMVAVFDFPGKAASAPADDVPGLAVDWIRGR